MYGLYKQATEGDVTGDRPGFMDRVGRSKYDAWGAIKGTSGKAAMQQYIDLVASLKG
jgi:acyl-CoA-binding protein